MSIIKCNVKVHNRDSEEFQIKLTEYERECERAENLGIQSQLEKPKPSEDYYWRKCTIYVKHLKETLIHYLEDCDDEGEIKLCFDDGSAMIIEKTDKIINQLDNL